ncbi:hypothetical protein [Rhizobium gallicum]|uniref:hypothetical protein n=1 Tax=Rhizobium gallicum TaxID=56730 RepID=UPI00037819E3
MTDTLSQIDQLIAEQKRMAERLGQIEQKLDRVLAQGESSENVMEPDPEAFCGRDW